MDTLIRLQASRSSQNLTSSPVHRKISPSSCIICRYGSRPPSGYNFGQEGSYLRSITFSSPVLITKATKYGHIISYCYNNSPNTHIHNTEQSSKPSLYLHHINGRLSESLELESPLCAMILSDDEEILITGDEIGDIKVYSLALAGFKVCTCLLPSEMWSSRPAAAARHFLQLKSRSLNTNGKTK